MSEGTNFLASVVATGSITALRQATAEHFVDEEERAVWGYLNRHLEMYAEIASVDAVLEQTGVELPEIEDSVDYHWSGLVDRKLYNDIRVPYNELRTALGANDMSSIRDIVGRMTTASMANEARRDLLPASEVADMTMQRYAIAHANPGVTGVPTGWDSIDRDTLGYQGGDLIIWAGRPATGKTWLLLRQLAAAHQAGYSTLFVSMEMSLTGIGQRFFGMMAGVNPRTIRAGRLSTRAERVLRETMEEYREENRLHFYAGNMGETTTALNAVIVERNPDIVFVDGVYFMRSPNANRNADRNSHVAYAIDDLKRFSLARDIPVVATTQFSRDAGRGGRRGSLENIAYTDAISTHASLIYSISPPDARARNQQSLIVRVQKGREGETTPVALRFEFSPVNFDETDINDAIDPREHGAGEVDLGWMRDANN